MSTKLFFSQELIDTWCDDEHVKFEGNVLEIQGKSGTQKYHLEPAYRVKSIASGDQDPHSLVGNVKTGAELAKLGADVYLGSCIVGETAYEVEPGFVAVKTEDEKNLDQLLTEYLLLNLK